MSDDKKPSMFPSLRLAGLAALAGILAGAAGVYVTGGFESNTGAHEPPAVPVQTAAATPDDLACEAKKDRAIALAKQATGQVAAMSAADPPVSLKTLAFNSPMGKPMTIGDLSNKTTLVNLWATWCAPCRAEMPALDALQKAKGSDKFEVVAVNVDTGDDSKPKAFLEETKVHSLAYYRDNTLALFNTLKRRGLALGLPVTLLVDGEGCLLATMNGPAEWSSPDAARLIDAALSVPGN